MSYAPEPYAPEFVEQVANEAIEKLESTILGLVSIRQEDMSYVVGCFTNRPELEAMADDLGKALTTVFLSWMSAVKTAQEGQGPKPAGAAVLNPGE